MLPISATELSTFAASPLGQVALGVAGSAAWDTIKSGASALGNIYDRLARERPDLNAAAHRAQATRDTKAAEDIARQATEAVLLMAENGTIQLDGAIVRALRHVDFNHLHGSISASDFTVTSDGTISVGGPAEATGTTHLHGGKSGSSLQTKGARVQMGSGTSIKITGGASMKIT